MTFGKPQNISQAFSLFALLLLTTAAMAGDRSSFELVNPHPFSRFGINMWVGDFPLERQIQFLEQLNVKAVRISITASVDSETLAKARTEADIEELIESEGTETWRESLAAFGKQSRDMGLEVHVVFYSTPAAWRTDRQRAGDQSKVDRFADPTHIVDNATWIAASLSVATKLGLKTDFVEIANEPDGRWNTFYTPEQYADLLLSVRSALKKVGLDTVRIEGAGSSKLSADADYIETLQKRSEISLLAALSGHDYMIDGAPSEGATPLEKSREALNATLPVHITEFSDASPRWGEAPFKTLPSKRGPDNGADSLAFGLGVAAEGLRLIADSASEIFLWELEDESWEGQSYGLIDINGHTRPLLGALRATVARIPTDSQVTGLKMDDAAFVFSKSNSGIALSGVNPEEKTIVVSLKLGSALNMSRMKLFCFPEDRQVSVKMASDKAETLLSVPPLTAFSVAWPP